MWKRAKNFLRILSPLIDNPQKHYNALLLFAQFVGPTFYEIENENVIKQLVRGDALFKISAEQLCPGP